MNELNKNEEDWEYQESLHEKYELLRGGNVESMEEWKKFRVIVKE